MKASCERSNVTKPYFMLKRNNFESQILKALLRKYAKIRGIYSFATTLSGYIYGRLQWDLFYEYEKLPCGLPNEFSKPKCLISLTKANGTNLRINCTS